MSSPTLRGADGKEPRYRFVDGLRGIAALAVVFHHLLHNTVLEPALRTVLPGAFQEFCHYGANGVQVFFVISGFVIAHSLRTTKITASAAGNFILRRQLRLDPPYWATLALVLALAFAENMNPRLITEPLPNLKAILVNAFYLQNITGTPPILRVAWTLCLEIQFYLVMIGTLTLGHWLDRRPGNGLPKVSVLLVFASGVISLAPAGDQQVFGAWMPPYWSYFAAGAICNWCLGGKVRQRVFFLFAGIFAIATLWQGTDAMIAGLATLLALYATGRAGHLTDWLGSGPLQYFGRISYSLYLIHLPILSIIMRAGYKLTGAQPWAALAWFALAAGASVFAAQVLYMTVERPSMRFAARLKKRSVVSADSGVLLVGASGKIIANREVIS